MRHHVALFFLLGFHLGSYACDALSGCLQCNGFLPILCGQHRNHSGAPTFDGTRGKQYSEAMTSIYFATDKGKNFNCFS